MRFVLDALPPAPPVRSNPVPQFSRPYLPLPGQRKRVAVTASSAGALINSCHSLILDMVNRGHRVSAFAPGLSNDDLRILSHLGVEPYLLPAQRAIWDKYRRVRGIGKILSDANPHVLFVESARNGAISVAAAKIARVPHVVTIVPSLGPAFMEGASAAMWGQRQALKTVYRAIFSWSDAVIFHNAHDRAYAQENKLLAEKKLHMTVGGWGEDLQRHVKHPLPPLDRGVLFLMATPLDRLQGILEFCEAAKALRLKARRARFFLASTPGDADAPLPTAVLRQYREFVKYIGPVDDPSRLIARCHVVVAPSYGNGAPRSLFQALALGRPIITTDTRSCRDFVQEGSNGYLVAVRDEAALARGMIQILHRPDLMPKMAEASRRLAMRYYDMNAVNSLVLEALGL
jgi:glycosyltransferase involved in cell wall biosynthesis